MADIYTEYAKTMMKQNDVLQQTFKNRVVNLGMSPSEAVRGGQYLLRTLTAEERLERMCERMFGGTVITIKNHAKPGEFKYEIIRTDGYVIRTNDINEFAIRAVELIEGKDRDEKSRSEERLAKSTERALCTLRDIQNKRRRIARAIRRKRELAGIGADIVRIHQKRD